MTFPQVVRRAFPHRDDADLRARIIELAQDGGDIDCAATEFYLTPKEQMTFTHLVNWLRKARTSTWDVPHA